jgi:hypothetical protein
VPPSDQFGEPRSLSRVVLRARQRQAPLQLVPQNARVCVPPASALIRTEPARTTDLYRRNLFTALRTHGLSFVVVDVRAVGVGSWGDVRCASRPPPPARRVAGARRAVIVDLAAPSCSGDRGRLLAATVIRVAGRRPGRVSAGAACDIPGGSLVEHPGRDGRVLDRKPRTDR